MLKTDMEDIKKIKFLGVTKQFPKWKLHWVELTED